MRFVIQRVKSAHVTVNNEVVGQIGRGFMILVGVSEKDTEEIADRMVSKMIRLRIFEDENNKTNLDLASVNGGLLIVSQFTLYADCRKGNRPSFIKAGDPAHAEALYEYILKKCAMTVPVVEHGIFGAEMDVSLVNDGPFTILLDSETL